MRTTRPNGTLDCEPADGRPFVPAAEPDEGRAIGIVNMNDSMLGAALSLARRGIRVFPCSPNKKPITTHGFQDASRDERQIADWWTQHPQALIGIPTGSATGLVVLDVDVDHARGKDGEASLAELVGRLGNPLPLTKAARTPRGGRHLYFKHPGGEVRCRTNFPGPSLDVRGDGGYVISPPSSGSAGHYSWVDEREPIELPQWLHRLLITNPRGTSPQASRISTPDIDRARDALRCVSGDCDRETWLRIGMALHDEFGEAGKSLWREWSATAPDRLVERDLERDWNSFTKGGGVTIATLLELAKKGGWRPGLAVTGGSKPTSTTAIPGEFRGFILPNDHHSITASAKAIFEAIAPSHTLFVREGVVTELAHRTDGYALEPVRSESFRSRLERYGRSLLAYKVDEAGNLVLKPKRCSEDHARALLATVEATEILPAIRIVTSAPILTAEGKILGMGYHPDLGGVLVTKGRSPPEVPIAEAVAAISGLLDEFDFQTPGDRSRAVAAIITPALRMGGHIKGSAPVDIAEADASQAGKGFRQRQVREIYGERAYVVTIRDGGVGSLDESIAAAVLSGRPFITLDNVRGRVESQFLEMILTWGESIPCRVPHRGEILVNPAAITFQMSSNGVEVTRDLANRASICRILKKPTGYCYRDYPEGKLDDHVRARQSYYLGCVFSVVREWIRRSRPRTRDPRHDFREWAGILDAIVQQIMGVGALLDGHEGTQERASNPALNWLRAVAMAVTSGGRSGDWVAAAEIFELCQDSDISLPGTQPSDETQGRQAVGRLLARCFQEAERIDGDRFVVERVARSEYDATARKNMTRRCYRFATYATYAT